MHQEADLTPTAGVAGCAAAAAAVLRRMAANGGGGKMASHVASTRSSARRSPGRESQMAPNTCPVRRTPSSTLGVHLINNDTQPPRSRRVQEARRHSSFKMQRPGLMPALIPYELMPHRVQGFNTLHEQQHAAEFVGNAKASAKVSYLKSGAERNAGFWPGDQCTVT